MKKLLGPSFFAIALCFFFQGKIYARSGNNDRIGFMPNLPQIMPVRKQVEVTTRILRNRLDTILPVALREADIDMWLIICQEDNLDPVYRTQIIKNWPTSDMWMKQMHPEDSRTCWRRITGFRIYSCTNSRRV